MLKAALAPCFLMWMCPHRHGMSHTRMTLGYLSRSFRSGRLSLAARFNSTKKTLDDLGVRYRKDKEMSAWLQAIQDAPFMLIANDQDFDDRSSFIQVKRLTADDLPATADAPLPEIEHEFDFSIDVVKLPRAIPGETFYPQILFIRPDEYAIFELLQTRRRTTLVENPGISKSWFQWKYILFSYRNDVFNQLRPHSPQIEQQEPPTKQQTLNDPDLIVRTIGGTESNLFFGRSPAEVIQIRHTPSHLHSFTDENSTILWEPGEREARVYFNQIMGRIIATVSPNIDRYKEFEKNGGSLCYMPCPSEVQLRLMGMALRQLTQTSGASSKVPSDIEIHQRVKKYGLCIRSSLIWKQGMELDKFLGQREEEIEKMNDPTRLQRMLKSAMHIEEKGRDKVMAGMSHRLVRYVVDRQSPYRYFAGSLSYRSSSNEIIELLDKRIYSLNVATVKKHLIDFNNGSTTSDDFIPTYLERIFACYASSGINWRKRAMPLVQSSESTVDSWEPYAVAFDHVVRKVESYETMDENTLYYPTDPAFPLVDMYYKAEDGKVVGIQATVARSHAKPVSTFEAFYRRIGASPQTTSLDLFYLILPRRLDSYTRTSYSLGAFFKSRKGESLQRGQGVGPWTSCVTFWTLVPPDTFESSYPDTV